eukprot:m.968413 g.968413  ORF g.968413 m.968413 type:complete len:182 (+) comp23917_c0_seq7:114-659(+)
MDRMLIASGPYAMCCMAFFHCLVRVLLAHDRIELDQGSNPTPFCPHHITNAGLPSVAERAALEATWTKTYKSLDDAFAARREKLYELWDAAWERRRSDNSGVSVCNSDVADCSESSIGHSSTESYTQRTHSEADMEGKAQEDKCIEAQCEGRLIDVYWPNVLSPPALADSCANVAEMSRSC